jgi:hypothetical protein
LVEYGDRVKPSFVVISVCPNDFGDGGAVMQGQGDWFEEAGHWLGEIQLWCRSRKVAFVLVPVPTYTQIENIRRDEVYPGKICEIFRSYSALYCDPLNEFVDEHMKIVQEYRRLKRPTVGSLLYNRQIHDDHFSPRGAKLWAEIVGRRITRLVEPHAPNEPAGKSSAAGTSSVNRSASAARPG